jgi:hypothetical protein
MTEGRVNKSSGAADANFIPIECDTTVLINREIFTKKMILPAVIKFFATNDFSDTVSAIAPTINDFDLSGCAISNKIDLYIREKEFKDSSNKLVTGKVLKGGFNCNLLEDRMLLDYKGIVFNYDKNTTITCNKSQSSAFTLIQDPNTKIQSFGALVLSNDCNYNATTSDRLSWQAVIYGVLDTIAVSFLMVGIPHWTMRNKAGVTETVKQDKLQAKETAQNMSYLDDSNSSEFATGIQLAETRNVTIDKSIADYFQKEGSLLTDTYQQRLSRQTSSSLISIDGVKIELKVTAEKNSIKVSGINNLSDFEVEYTFDHQGEASAELTPYDDDIKNFYKINNGDLLNMFKTKTRGLIERLNTVETTPDQVKVNAPKKFPWAEAFLTTIVAVLDMAAIYWVTKMMLNAEDDYKNKAVSNQPINAFGEFASKILGNISWSTPKGLSLNVFELRDSLVIGLTEITSIAGYTSVNNAKIIGPTFYLKPTEMFSIHNYGENTISFSLAKSNSDTSQPPIKVGNQLTCLPTTTCKVTFSEFGITDNSAKSCFLIVEVAQDYCYFDININQ